jgi:hypothetical protein
MQINITSRIGNNKSTLRLKKKSSLALTTGAQFPTGASGIRVKNDSITNTSESIANVFHIYYIN